MPTDKRERQKANRAERKAREAAAERRQRTIRLAIRVAIIAAIVIVAFVLIQAIFGSDSDDEAATDTTAPATETTVPGTETTAPAEAQPIPASYDDFRAQETACGAEAPPPRVLMEFAEPVDQGIGPDDVVAATFTTSCGDVVVEFDQGLAPETVNSMVFLAREGFFDGTAMHRVVPGFVVQGGDPTATGTGGSGYSIPDEFPDEGFAYDRGVVAMANAGPGTTGSQFFWVLDATGLGPQFNPVGTIVEGLDIVDRIAEVPTAGEPGREPSTPLETIYIDSVTVSVS
jgi:peptidyl-prolyl cis-trans isomerase B (cyclophilin B)